MSQLEISPRRGKLPPMGHEDMEPESVQRTSRKKKAKQPQCAASDNAASIPRRMPPRPPNSARSDSNAYIETVGSRDLTPRIKQPKRTRHVEDTINVDDEQMETLKPRKKRRLKQKITESQEELVEQSRVNADPTLKPSDVHRKKKRKKVGVEEPSRVGLEAELYELEDDIVTEGNDESFEENHYGNPAVMRSEPINKIFIEKRSGFKTASKDKITRKRANMQRQVMTQEPQQAQSTIQFAISSHRVFKTIVLFLQGLLGGICLWQIISVYMLSRQGYDILLEQYTKIAMPVNCMFYFLLAVSTVAVFDKNDIARPNKKFIIQSVTMQTTAVACFFYLAGLIFNTSIAHLDDKIGLYTEQPELWEDEQVRDEQLKMWVSLNLVRGLTPILGWMVISISPKSDRLIENLEKADENIIEGLEEPAEGETVIRANGV